MKKFIYEEFLNIFGYVAGFTIERREDNVKCAFNTTYKFHDSTLARLITLLKSFVNTISNNDHPVCILLAHVESCPLLKWPQK